MVTVTYLSLRENKVHDDKLCKLWNKEYKNTFPISNEMFNERLLEDENLNLDASIVAYFENVPIGFIIVKTWKDDSPFYKDESIACISLIFVAKEFRNNKVGSELLKLSLNYLANNTKVKKVSLGNDVYHVFPGLPNEFNDSIIFFLNHGMKASAGNSVDMIKKVKKSEIRHHNQSDLTVRIATEDDKDALLRLCLDNNYNKEAYLINKYYERGGTGRRIVLGVVNQKIIGFARIFDHKRSATKINMFTDKTIGSLSMLVVDKNLENYDEYKRSLSIESERYLIMRKCKKIVIECTSDIDFYKELGYRVFKYYLYFSINLDEYRGL